MRAHGSFARRGEANANASRATSGRLFELNAVQAAVEFRPPQQLVVRADVENPPALHHHDPIGQGQGGHAMRDDDGRAVADELFQHFVDQLLAFQIDLARRLVQNQQAGIPQDRPGQGDPLPLTPREQAAARADDRLVAPLELGLDEPVGMRLFGGFDHFFSCGLGRPVADVVEDRIVEEQGFLGDQADLRADVSQTDVAQVDSIDPHAASDWVVESRDQVGQGRLAATVGADNGDRLAKGDPQVDFLQHRLARVVVELHAVEDQLPAMPRQRHGMAADRRRSAGDR